uniref:Peptidase S1 domain-containing protein n=1 Tax=Tetranychus urticae TaxID=32264 RepID=A0A158P4N2_TETUR
MVNMLQSIFINLMLLNIVSCPPPIISNITNVCDCGKIDPTNSNYWPWLVKIRSRFADKVIDCQGVLISSFDILTAGHCVYSSKIGTSSLVTVYLPLTNPISSQIEWIQQEVHRFKYDYRSTNTSHDIAVINLIERAPDYYQPICLTSLEMMVSNGIVIGFNENIPKYNSIVHQSNVEIISDCEFQRQHWLNFSKSTENNLGTFTGYDPINFSIICGINSASKNVSILNQDCQHIPGQPLIHKSTSDGRWFLDGIVSGTWFNNKHDCYHPFPTIYVSVLFYSEWIYFNSIECCLNTDN